MLDTKKEELIAKLIKGRNETKGEDLIKHNFDKITSGMDIFRIEIDLIDDAPDEWNFYKKLDDGKLAELIESILENGLLSPVIVWEQEDRRYMMLAGHNRLRAFRMIYERTQDAQYKKIHAYIKKKNEIAEDEAKVIIIDTNFVQRQLSTIEKTKSIVYKYNMLGRKKRNSEGRLTHEIIQEEYGLKRSQIFNYLKLKNLHPDFMSKIDTGILSMVSGIKLSGLPMDVQEKLVEDKIINNESVKKINCKNYDEILSQIIDDKSDEKFETLKIKIPADKMVEFEEFIHKWDHFDLIEME